MATIKDFNFNFIFLLIYHEEFVTNL